MIFAKSFGLWPIRRSEQTLRAFSTCEAIQRPADPWLEVKLAIFHTSYAFTCLLTVLALLPSRFSPLTALAKSGPERYRREEVLLISQQRGLVMTTPLLASGRSGRGEQGDRPEKEGCSGWVQHSILSFPPSIPITQPTYTETQTPLKKHSLHAMQEMREQKNIP